MVLEQMPKIKSESQSELENIENIIADIKNKASLIEGKEDAHNLLDKIKECNEKCNELDHDQGSEKREELRKLSTEVLRHLRRFETADKQEFNEVIAKIPGLPEEVRKVKEELRRIKKQAI